jgi:hypothetical protein
MGLPLTGYSTFLGMKAQSDQTAAKVAADQANQQLALERAGDAMQRGSFEAMRARFQGGAVVGNERAGFGASGVDTNSGSAATVQAQSSAMSSLNAQTILNNAAREAWGHKVSAIMYGNEAQADRTSGGYAETGVFLGGLGQAQQQILQAATLGVGAFGAGK